MFTLFTLALLLLLPLPLVAAAPILSSPDGVDTGGLARSSVGTFDVSPSRDGGGGGMARGSIVSGIVGTNDASGVGTLRSLAIASSGATATGQVATTVFSSVDIDGFVPTSQLRGVGTSALQLEGNGISLALMDNVNSLLMIQAAASRTDTTRVTFVTPPDITITKDATLDNVLLVSGSAGSALGGALILTDVQGGAASGVTSASSLALASAHEVRTTLAAGAQVIFRANTAYASSASAGLDGAVQAYDRVVIDALAKARIAGEATTDFSGGADLIVNANAFASATTRTSSASAHRVTTVLKTQAEEAAVVADEACAEGWARVTGTGSAAGSAGPATGQANAATTGDATAQACVKTHVLAYNLDYVDIPARSADNVAVYIDGALGQRVAAAADVATHANAYWATTLDGRVLVLTNVATRAHHASEITVAAVADANAAASTLVQLDAQDDITSAVSGGFEMLGSLQASASGAGTIIGTFSSFLATEAKGNAAVRDVTDIRSSTQLFSKIEFAADTSADAAAAFAYGTRATATGGATTSARHAGEAVVEMTTSVGGSAVVVTRFTDSAFATIEAEARTTTLMRFQLGQEIGVSSVAGAQNVLQLDGPAGRVGYLVLTRVEEGAGAAGHFEVTGQKQVDAHLLAGGAVIFRSAADARTRASAEVIVDAIARGSLASEASIGFVANTVNSATVDYRSHVHMTLATAADATHRGQATFVVAADAASSTQARVVSIVSDQATLAARDATDILVKLNGQAAASASTAATLMAHASAGATTAEYFATTSLNGQTHVLVLLPATAGAAANLVIESRLDAQRRLDAALDVFGSFTAGYGGAARGDIVSLVARQDVGLLLDYTVAARSDATASEGTVTSVFDSVRLGTSALATAGAASATALRFQNEQGTIDVFDVSSAVLKLTAHVTTTADLDLAHGITAVPLGPQVIMLSAPDFSGAVILVDAAQATVGAIANTGAASSLAVSASGHIVAELHAGAELVFKAFSGFESQLSGAQREAQARAIAAGNVIGQIIVRSDVVTRTTSSTAVNYFPAVASSAVVGTTVAGGAQTGGSYAGYGAVQAITQVASTDKVELVVTSATTTGKSLILSLDRHTVRGLLSGDAQLLIDGRHIDAATSYEDALVPDKDKYFLMTAGDEVGLQAVVTLAHFSTRTITLETPQAPSVFLWTTIALGVIVVSQAAYPAIRRRMS